MAKYRVECEVTVTSSFVFEADADEMDESSLEAEADIRIGDGAWTRQAELSGHDIYSITKVEE